MLVDRNSVRNAFASYVSNYDPSNPRIALKIAHTHRVANLCDHVAPKDKDLAWLCGMLHDIGRFEQVRVYNTFNDAASVPHAALGVDVLFGNADPNGPQIRMFVADTSEDKLIRTVIATHSDYRLPLHIDERTRMHCNVLRDADKIDIIKVNRICPLQDIYGVSEEDMSNSDLSDEVEQIFYEHRTIPRGVRRHPADVLVGHICFAWELVHPQSVSILMEQGYLDQMLNMKFANKATDQRFRRMASHMRKELACSAKQ